MAQISPNWSKPVQTATPVNHSGTLWFGSELSTRPVSDTFLNSFN